MRRTPSATSTDARWKRLQTLLIRIKPGQRVTVDDVAAKTGLTTESVDTVLRALTRAALFHRTGATSFVRDSLLSKMLSERKRA